MLSKVTAGCPFFFKENGGLVIIIFNCILIYQILRYNEFYFSHIYLFFSHLLLMLRCIVKMILLVITTSWF